MGYNWSKDQALKAGFSPLAAPMLAGLFADAVAAPLWIPSEVITSRLQIQGPGVVKYESGAHVFRHIVATEGVRGLFTGLGVQIVAFGPASALWWVSYEATADALRAWLRRRRDAAGVPPAAHQPPPLASGGAPAGGNSGGGGDAADGVESSKLVPAVSGLVAGVLTSIVTNPLDIAKTRLQTQHSLLREFEAESAQKAEAGLRGRLEKERHERMHRRTGFFKKLRAAHDVRMQQLGAPSLGRLLQQPLVPPPLSVTGAPAASPLAASAHAATAAAAAPQRAIGSQQLQQPFYFLLRRPALVRQVLQHASVGGEALSSFVLPPPSSAAAHHARGLLHPGSSRSDGGGGGPPRALADSGLLTTLQRLATAKQREGAARAVQAFVAGVGGSQPPSSAAGAVPSAPATGYQRAPSLGFTPYQSSVALNSVVRLEAAALERGRLVAAEEQRVGRRRWPSFGGGSGNQHQTTTEAAAAARPISPGRRARAEAAAVAQLPPAERAAAQELRAIGRSRGYLVRFPPLPPLPAAAAAAAAQPFACGGAADKAAMHPVHANSSTATTSSSSISSISSGSGGGGGGGGSGGGGDSSSARGVGGATKPLGAQLRTWLLGPHPTSRLHSDPQAFYPRASLRSAGLTRLHDNMYTMLAAIVRNEGAWALTRGLLPRMVVNGPASAATFVIYEQVLALSLKPPSAAAPPGGDASMLGLER